MRAGFGLAVLLIGLWNSAQSESQRNPQCRRGWVEHTYEATARQAGESLIIVISHSQGYAHENVWHCDMSWREAPSMGIMLRAVKIPAVVGDTLYTNMAAIYADLDDEPKSRLERITAIHDLTPFSRDWYPKRLLAKLRRRDPPFEHPVVCTHLETGQQILFINPLFTSHICQLDRDASDEVRNMLFGYIEKPEYQCRFRWRDDSIALRDNRVCVHYATADYWPHERVMERILIAGEQPRR